MRKTLFLWRSRRRAELGHAELALVAERLEHAQGVAHGVDHVVALRTFHVCSAERRARARLLGQLGPVYYPKRRASVNTMRGISARSAK